MSKLREILITSSETSSSLDFFEEKKIHSNIVSILQNAKPKIILHLGSLSHAVHCGRIIDKNSEILYAKNLTLTIEDWMSPEREKLRHNGIPNLYNAHMEYLHQENLTDVITILNSDLSVIAELLMIKEIVPDIIMMDESFDHIDPTIFTSPLTSLPLILQDFSFSNIKIKGNNNLLLNSPYYENIVLQKNYVIASKSFEKILKLTGKANEDKSEKTKSVIQESKKTEKNLEIEQPIKTEKPPLEEQVIDNKAEETAIKNEKRKKILEEKARIKAERRRRRTAVNTAQEQKTEASAAPIQQQAAPIQQQTAPIQQQTAPIQQQAAPIQQQAAPIQQQAAPIQQQTAPIQQYAAPIQPQAAPIQPQTAPIQQQAAPIQQQAAPIQQQAAPAVPNTTEQPQVRPRPIRKNTAPIRQQAIPAEPIQQQAAQVAQQTAPLPTEGQQEEVVNSAKRALLQKRLRERLAK